MKQLLIAIAVVAAGWIGFTLLSADKDPGFEPEEGYRLLYMEGSLQGWTQVGGEATFSASGDAIEGRYGAGDNSFLRTDTEFSDFSLKLQMRWDEFGNSGIMFRAKQRDGNGRTFGYQYELDPSDRAFSGGIYDEARRGWLAPLDNNQPAREAIRLNDWNDVEIEARGAHIKTWINGVAAADIVDGLDASGFIALQVHSGNSGVMRWRRIQIKELESVAEKVSDGLDPGEWKAPDIDQLQVQSGALIGQRKQEDAWLISRRLLSDAVVKVTLPACKDPSVLRLRHARESGQASYAEVSLTSDSARGRIVTAEGTTDFDPVFLDTDGPQSVTAAVVGSALTITVGEQDVLRVDAGGLIDRGELHLRPADCGAGLKVSDFSWVRLRDKTPEDAFYKTLDTEPAPPLTVEQSLQAFSLAPGFVIEPVATEPLVAEPVAMTWDEHGRLYVVEMHGYMRDAYGTDLNAPVGQVVRLEDTDGDGRMDVSEVFLGNVVNPRAVAVVNEGVLVGVPPDLLLCELPDYDSVCTSPRSIAGYGEDYQEANIEHIENGLRPGLDNRLYNSKSTRRLKIQGDQVEVTEGLFRGQWGLSRDDYGRLFYNHNSTWIQADLFAAEDLLSSPTMTPPAGLGVNLTPMSEVYSVRVNPGVNRAYLPGTLREDGRLHKATGASSLVVYRGHQFPLPYRGHVFVPESAGNVVSQFAISEQGMELAAEQQLYADERWGQRDFLASTDERFRPVDAMNGPDGALYIVDMYRGIIQDDHFLTEELRDQIFQRQLDTPIGMGRIWRIRHVESPQQPVPDLASASATQLVQALTSDNGWTRDTAQRLLLAREDHITGDLNALTLADDNRAAIHAVWVLEGRGELTAAQVLKVLAVDDPVRQQQVLRAGRAVLGSNDLVALAPGLRESNEAVRMQLAFALGDHAGNAAVRQQLVGILSANLSSPYVTQAVLRAVQGHELVFIPEVLASPELAIQSTLIEGVLAALVGKTYRSLRPELDSEDLADPQFFGLLDLVASRDGEQLWQQLAMLKGFSPVLVETGFVPAQLPEPPALFVDSSIEESDPRWPARLNARRAFTWPGDELALGLTPLGPTQLQQVAQGEAFYPKCAACHGQSGAGISGLAPALAGAEWVVGPPEWLTRIILQGMTGPVTVNGEHFNGVMPPHGHLPELDDATLAGLMTFIRRNWDNRADPVSVEQVSEVRTSSAGRSSPWTAEELRAVPFDRGYGRLVGDYTVSFLTFSVTEAPEGLHLSVPMYGSGILTPITDVLFAGAAGGETIKVEFVPEDNGMVNKLLLHRKGEKIPLRRKAE